MYYLIQMIMFQQHQKDSGKFHIFVLMYEKSFYNCLFFPFSALKVINISTRLRNVIHYYLIMKATDSNIHFFFTFDKQNIFVVLNIYFETIHLNARK